MGADSYPRAVVYALGKVRGVEALRVVEASILPDIPSVPTNVTTISLMRENGGDGIIEVLMPDERVSFYREKKRVNKSWGADRGERTERWRTALKLLTKTSLSPALTHVQNE
jgi:GMC oxidoreductase